MHIHWLFPSDVIEIDEISKSNMASLRLRTGALVEFISHSSHVITVGNHLPSGADVCIIGKIGGSNTAYLHQLWLSQLKTFNGKIILDFTDDHLNFQTTMSDFYRDSLKIIDAAVCSSSLLKTSLETKFDGDITIIPDAIEYIAAPPTHKNNNPATMLWFGHNTNMDGLIHFIQDIKFREEYNLIILSNSIGIKQIAAVIGSLPANIKIQGGLWSHEAMLKYSQSCNLCIIPTNLKHSKKAGASSNRLITSLTLGLPTCADAIDSYSPYTKYFGNLRNEDFIQMLKQPNLWYEKIFEFQSSVTPQFTKNYIGSRWMNLCSS